MSRTKPPLTHSRFAREIAKQQGSTAEKKARLAEVHRNGIDTKLDPLESATSGGLEVRIGATDRLHDRPTFEGNVESRQANQARQREYRIDNARLQAKQDAARRIHGARMGHRGETGSVTPAGRNPTSKVAPYLGPRVAGREKVEGYFGALGIFRPAYSSRIDSEKRGQTSGIHRTRVSLPRPGG